MSPVDLKKVAKKAAKVSGAYSRQDPKEVWKQKAEPQLPWSTESDVKEGMKTKLTSVSQVTALEPSYVLTLGSKDRYYQWRIIDVSKWLVENGVLSSHGGVQPSIFALVAIWRFKDRTSREIELGWTFNTAGNSVESLEKAVQRRAQEKLKTWKKVHKEHWYGVDKTVAPPWNFSGLAVSKMPTKGKGKEEPPVKLRKSDKRVAKWSI